MLSRLPSRPIATALIALGLGGCTPEESTPRPYRPPADNRQRGDPVVGDSPGDPGTGDAPTPYWHCKPTYYGTDDGCDCGCGIPDPDCNGQGCSDPTCDQIACEFCHNATGVPFTCGTTPPPEVPSAWTCELFFYSDQLCDCGCSVPDIDCGGAGCSTPACTAVSCEYCWDGFDAVSCGASDGGPPAGD